MTISEETMIEPLSTLKQDFLQLVNPETGLLTSEGAQFFKQIRDFISGMCRIIPIDIVGQNALTLLPVKTAPIVKGYFEHEIYLGRAVATSNGLVTATVEPTTGSLDILKVYKTNGAAQAGSGDVVNDSVYMFVYAAHLDGGNGGFVLK